MHKAKRRVAPWVVLGVLGVVGMSAGCGSSIDDRMQTCPSSIKKPDDRRVDVPSLVGLRGAHTDGGLGRMKASTWTSPAALANKLAHVVTEAKTPPIRWA